MKSPIITSSAVDDADLSPVEFRVLAHICRRAGDGDCWAGTKSVAKVCRVNLKTARKAVAVLVEKGWVKSMTRNGQTTVLTPCFPDQKTAATLPNPIPYPIEYPSQSDTHHPTQSDTPHPTQSDTPEGYPIRIPKKETHKVILVLPFSSLPFAEAWSLWIDHRKALKKPSTPQSQKMALNKLSKMPEHEAIAAINHSVENNWQSIYPPKSPPPAIRPTREQFTFQKNGQQFRPFD